MGTILRWFAMRQTEGVSACCHKIVDSSKNVILVSKHGFQRQKHAFQI